MKPPRNWYAVVGLVLGIAGVVAYFLLILTHDPTLHHWLEFPVANLLVIAVGVMLSCVGAYRGLARTHRGRIVAPLLAVLNLAFAGMFSWWLFAYSYRMPVSAHAPAVDGVAPDFALPDERGSQVRLSSLRGRPVVLLFYRGFW